LLFEFVSLGFGVKRLLTIAFPNANSKTQGRGDCCSSNAVLKIPAARGVDTRTLQAFMGHRSIANTVVYIAVADKRIRNIWGKQAQWIGSLGRPIMNKFDFAGGLG
jgi:hypothetical protein